MPHPGDRLDEEHYDRQYPDRVLAGRIFAYLRRHGRQLVLVSLLVLLMAGLGALEPIVVAWGVDRLLRDPGALTAELLSILVLSLGLLWWFCRWLHRRLSARVLTAVIRDLQNDAFRAALAHDLSFYDEFASGKVLSRITSDTRDLGQLAEQSSWLVSSMVQALILGVVLVRIEWRLALILFALIPVVFAFSAVYRIAARRVTRRGMRAIAGVNAAIKESVSGIAVAKNFRREEGIYEEFDSANQLSYRTNLWRGLVMNMAFPLLTGIGGCFSGIMVYAGGVAAIDGLVTAGAWYLFVQSLDRFLYPVMHLSSFITDIQNGLSAAERVFALMDAERTVAQTGGDPVPADLAGAISFREVTFHYRPEEPVLDRFCLHIAPGETVAVVGHTGAGKTSIARLIARFYEFQDGDLLIDGHDIRALDLAAYRRRVGIISQTPFLFSGTVADNIRFAEPGATDEEILTAARQIGDGEWLDVLPNGIHTPVGERGALLSLGQRQLVALVRVLIQRPAIFLLDEATASVDPFTEWQIQQALQLVFSRTTAMVIAHRLSTVKSADRIIVLDQGRIIEQGSHRDLVDGGGHYATLYNTYFRHQSLAYVEQSGGQLGGATPNTGA